MAMNKRLLKIIAAACSLTFVAAAAFGVASLKGSDSASAKAYEITLEKNLEEEYELGASLSIPSGTIEGVQASKFVVLSPSGKVYDAATLSLTETGRYTIIWYATVDGKEISAEKTFLVTQGVFTADGGVECNYVESLFRVPTKDLNGDGVPGTDGIKVSLEPEGTFYYNKAIDLSDSSVPFAHVFPYHDLTNIVEVNDKLTDVAGRIKPVNNEIKALEKQIKAVEDKLGAVMERISEIDEALEAEETTQEEKTQLEAEKKSLQETQTAYEAEKVEYNKQKTGKQKELEALEKEEAGYKSEYQFEEDARNYLITLTDCYDSTNYITIDLEWQDGRTYWNFRAGPTGQKTHGLRTTITDKASAITADGTLYQCLYAPSQGTTSCNIIDDYGLKLYYDTEKDHLYIEFCRYDKGAYTVKKVLVSALANKDIYPENPFKGFTTGEVYLSIKAKNHLRGTASIDIASLGGVTGVDILKAEKDTLPPKIQMKEGLRANTLIALNEQVTVPDAYALDLNLPYGTKASVAVYYAYDPNKKNNALIGLTNGKFTPKKAGIYTIVYSAVDKNGNLATATVDLGCLPSLNDKAVNLTVEDSFEGKAGEYFTLPECKVDGLYTNASAVKVYLRGDNGESILVNSNQIFLDGVKEYEVTYVYETPFNTYTATCTVKALASDIVLMDTPILPEYFIKNATYTLDTVYAYEYKTEKPVAVNPTVFMKSDDGAFEKVDDPKAVTITAKNSVQFQYEYGNNTTVSEVIKVVDVGFGGSLLMKEYFQSEEDVFTKTAFDEGIRYATNGVAKEATLKYINTISLSAFSIEFSLLEKIEGEEKEYKAPARLTFTLVDYYDRNNKVELSFVDGTKLFVNGQQEGTLEKNIFGQKTTVSYDEGFVLDGVTYPWSNTFTSDKALLWIRLEGMNGSACLEVNRLCDRRLTNEDYDSAEPTLYIAKTNTGYQDMDKVITISQAFAYDLIAPYLEENLRLVVKNPDGSFATSVDGVLLDGTCPVDRDYQLKMEKLGTYLVLYEYTDQNGGYCSFGYSPIVKDQIALVLEVEGVEENAVLKAAWGSNVKVASYKVSDDVSDAQAITAWIEVIYPSNIMREVSNGGTFYAEEKGDYTVIYCAFDEMGNYTTFAYVVTVA